MGGFDSAWRTPSEPKLGGRVIWANQWEPSSKKQHAVEVYAHRWGMEPTADDPDIFEGEDGDLLVSKNIEKVLTKDIPEHDVLCGGFPCQDYSVARTISGEMGIEGEKGKLWNSIKRVLSESSPRPSVVFLENVPRILNSPARHRGLNFTVILGDLIEMGYVVEWRVINAADYGFPQKEEGVYLAAKGEIATPADNSGKEELLNGTRSGSARARGRWARKRWCQPDVDRWVEGAVPQSLIEVTIENDGKNVSPYKNTGLGFMDDSGNPVAITFRTRARFDGALSSLGEIIEADHDEEYQITDHEAIRKYTYVKGEQKEWRIRKADSEAARGIMCSHGQNLWEHYQTLTRSYDSSKWADSRADSGYVRGVEMGIVYQYSAGAMAFPDPLERPSRTIVTSEVGKSVSRMRHVIEYEEGSYRRLMPIELELLNMFPPGWTGMDGISDSRRGFLMGNALVVGIVEGIAGPLERILRNSQRGGG